MTFEEWWKKQFGGHHNYRDNPMIMEPARAAWDAAVAAERDRILAIVHKYAHTDYACQSEGVDVARDIESEINA